MRLYITGFTLKVIGLHKVTWGHNLATYNDDEWEERNPLKSQNPQRTGGQESAVLFWVPLTEHQGGTVSTSPCSESWSHLLWAKLCFESTYVIKELITIQFIIKLTAIIFIKKRNPYCSNLHGGVCGGRGRGIPTRKHVEKTMHLRAQPFFFFSDISRCNQWYHLS